MTAVVVGLGSSRGVCADAVRTTLRAAVNDLREIVAFATVDRRRDEPGLLAVVREHGAALRCYPPAELDAVEVPRPSEAVRGYVGTRSVAEAAALLAARDLGGGSLLVPKLRGEHVTVAVALLNPLTISSACTACGACLLTCPEHALRPAPCRPAVVASRCTSCGECVEICPADAITLRDEAGSCVDRIDPHQIGDLEDSRVDHSPSSSDQGSGGGTDGTFGTPGEGEPTA